MEYFEKSSTLLRKAIGKIQRKIISTPTTPVRQKIMGKIEFEHKYESYLNEDDFKAMLTNSYDIILVKYLEKHLREGDIFVDVGSNIGYIAAVAAACVGKSGEVHGFEPLKELYSRLEKLQSDNQEYKFFFNNLALGKESGTLNISFNPDHDARNATIVPGHDLGVTYEVPVTRLDSYIIDNISSPGAIKIIKIDVEGFEFPVLLGLENFLEKHKPIIICEYKPWELSKLGLSSKQLKDYMKKLSYQAYDINNEANEFDIEHLKGLEVLLFKPLK